MLINDFTENFLLHKNHSLPIILNNINHRGFLLGFQLLESISIMASFSCSDRLRPRSEIGNYLWYRREILQLLRFGYI